MSAGSSFGGMCAAPEISAIVIDLSGEPRTWYLPSVSSMSSGAASSSAAQMRFALSWTSLRRAHDRLAAHRQRARAVGVPAPRALVGVAVEHVHVLRVDPEDVAGDLGEARVEPLAVRRRAGVDDRRAGGRHAHVRGLPERRLEAHALRARPRATAPGRTPRPRSRSRRRGARPRRAGRSCSARNSSRSKCSSSLSSVPVVVARVVDDAERGLERELLLRDEVLPPQLEPVHAELVGEPVHHQLDPVGGLRPARPADRVRGHLVREHAREVQVDVRDPVAAAHHREAELRDERREQLLVGAEVGDDPHLAAR